ncbi:MAG: sigma-70 family RNA polymerase sigma factor [Planctomycetota bacterium]|nr:sigma-70 family RNA polymerase sigma factor [Planctomycetota bacterium]
MNLPLGPEPRLLASAVEEPGDADLLLRAREGDHRAFATLVKRWEEPAYRLAFRVTGDHAAAEDVRQVVFLRLLESATRLRKAESFAAWLRRSVVNEAINVLRAGWRRQAAARRRAETTGAGRDELDGAPGRGPEEEDDALRLRAALGELAPADRVLLALRFDEDLKYREMAAVLKRPVSTVKTQVQRAMDRLRRRLRPPLRPGNGARCGRGSPSSANPATERDDCQRDGETRP